MLINVDHWFRLSVMGGVIRKQGFLVLMLIGGGHRPIFEAGRPTNG
jgi:hypothetical protein